MVVNLSRRSENWIVPDWPAPANVRALITTRAGGVSLGPYSSLNLGDQVGDDPQCVAENRTRLRACLPDEPVWLKQVHGNRTVEAATAIGVPEADASITGKQGIVLAIQTADCLPVLICDQAGMMIGVAHAGWRGLCSGVLENTVRAMGQAKEIAESSLLAYLGPAIGPDNFEVGPEVRQAFLAHAPDAADHFKQKENGKWLADLYGLARKRLTAMGVTRIYGGDFCTVAEPDRFFSYRRDRITGRMATLLWLDRPAAALDTPRIIAETPLR